MPMANAIVDTATYGTVKCPICELAHDLRQTKNKGTPFFVCDTCGSGTVVFIRSAWAKDKLKQWTGRATQVTLRNETVEDRTTVQAKGAEAVEAPPSDEKEEGLRRFVKGWSSSPSSFRPVRRRSRP